jgi:hypothetical protein
MKAILQKVLQRLHIERLIVYNQDFIATLIYEDSGAIYFCLSDLLVLKVITSG